MPYLLRKDVYENTKRLLQGVGELGTPERDFKEWLEKNYNFKICNIVFDYPIYADENYSDNYVVYVIHQESRVNSKRVYDLINEHYNDWLIGFINIALRHHLKVNNKLIEIKLFDFYEEICYDFQRIYNVHFDADEYYKTLNRKLSIYKCFRLFRPVILFYTEEHRKKYEAEGKLDLIQEQYEEFLSRYDIYGAAASEKVIFGSKEQLDTEYQGDINRYFI